MQIEEGLCANSMSTEFYGPRGCLHYGMRAARVSKESGVFFRSEDITYFFSRNRSKRLLMVLLI